jgi:hypothetical protein
MEGYEIDHLRLPGLCSRGGAADPIHRVDLVLAAAEFEQGSYGAAGQK